MDLAAGGFRVRNGAPVVTEIIGRERFSRARPRLVGVSKRGLPHGSLDSHGKVYGCEAAALLERGDHTIADVAMLVGYTDISAFNRAFREQFGVPPGRYFIAAAESAHLWS